MKRRDFIKNTSTAVTLPVILNGLKLSAFAKPLLFNTVNNASDRVLVLIQLNGGNDGLNAVIPLDQYSHLFSARAEIIIPEDKVIPLTETLGLHPTMTGVKALYDDGNLGLVQSVGYPNQNRSHFRSMEIWSTASPANQFWNTGWMGRFLDEKFPGFPNQYPDDQNPDPFAISMGFSVSATCQGAAANFSITLNNPFTLRHLEGGGFLETVENRYDEELAFIRSTIGQTNDYSDRIVQAANGGNNAVEYPDTELAQQLKNVALLIAGGLKTKIYIVSLGGFDTHANQVDSYDPARGRHAELLGTLADAMRAFQKDIKQLGLEERVIGMTFSEFGRQIRANDSDGTDHGTAAPLMLFGACVNPQILGENPEIPDVVEVQEGVPMQYDFRDVYGSVLMDWFGLPEENIKSLLHPDFYHLPIIRDCNAPAGGGYGLKSAINIPVETHNFPNPFSDTTTIYFSTDEEKVRLSIFDAQGNEIKQLINERYSAGEHQITFDGRSLPPGNYYYRLVTGGRQKTKRMVKVQ